MTKTGYIYKLAIKDGSIDNIYIGSTECTKQRKRNHKLSCNTEKMKAYNYYVYQFIRDNGGFDNWELYILDKIEFTDKFELKKKEREYIERLKPSLNKNIPARTPEEFKKHKKEYMKTRYENNKDKIKEYTKEYYKTNTYKLREYDKNRNKIRVMCDICNKEINYAKRWRHDQGERHNALIK